VDIFEPYPEDPEETTKRGVEFAIRQCEDLIANGVPGLHFYTLNKSKATLLIYQAIKHLIPPKVLSV
jgi:methylenetetrahydrofolate reductase (NADPH)